MVIHGYIVSDEVKRACFGAMRRAFKKSDIEKAAIQAGAPISVGEHPFQNGVADRIADRLIQQERKLGNIKRVAGGWMPA